MMFYLGALALGLIACLFVLLPLLRRTNTEVEDERTDLNVALFQEHISELSQEEDAEQLTLEAQKVLLSETAGDESLSSKAAVSKNVFLITAICLPVFAGLIYLDTGFGRGAMPDYQLTRQLQETNPADRSAYRRFVTDVEARARQKPEDEDIQFLLARAYLTLEEYAAASEVMKELVNRFPEDPNLLSQYAEVLYLQAGRKVNAQVDAAIDRTLQVNPGDVTMMEIRAISAIQAGDRETARAWFQRALGTGITGRRAEIIRMTMSRLLTTESGTIESDALQSDALQSDEREPRTTEQLAAAGRSIQVRVSSAGETEVSDTAVVFVYARAASGPPAPLAVQRFPVSHLPVTLTLDESMAMVPGMSLGTFDEVLIIARISQTGQVAPAPGDYEARSALIDLTGEVGLINLEIADRIQ